MKSTSLCTKACSCVLVFLLLSNCIYSETQQYRPSGRIKGKEAPPGQCNKENDYDCCEQGRMYKTYECSPEVTSHTKTYLTLNSFEKNGDGGGPSDCDNQYHSNDMPVVAISTGWFNHKSRCHKKITINGNGRSVDAMEVDQCDSTKGCNQKNFVS